MSRLVRRALTEERGLTIVEAVLAITLLALTAGAFATTVGQGLQLVGTSKERQTAVQLATKWMEQSRAISYDGLVHRDTTEFDGGTGTPDEDVSGTIFDGPDGPETLVLDATATGIPQDEAITTSGVAYHLYRYVTWVPDADGSPTYKRVTVVVDWDGSADTDVPVMLSTIISGDGVSWSSTTTTVAPASTTTSSTSTTSTTVGDCPGDVTAPSGSMSILAGTGANTGYTSSSTVTLSLSATDPCTPLVMAFSNDGSSYSAGEPYSTSKSWTLTAGNGDRTVYVRFSDNAGNASVAQATIRVDGSLPTTPGSFTASKLTSPRRTYLTWTSSTDNDTLIGYRVYRREGSSGAYGALTPTLAAPCSTNPCSYTDSTVQNNRSYSYYVVAYDAAGNESIATSVSTVTF